MSVWNVLNELNPTKAQTVHPNNLKRVIRYIELEKCPSSTNTIQKSILTNYNCLNIGIIADRNYIYDKINKRVDKMIKNGLEKLGIIKKQ